MSRWLFIVSFVALTSVSMAEAAPSSAGPTSSAEAEILWKEGKEAFEAGRYSDAISPLRRLVDRYAGTKNFTEAHLLLGDAYLETDQPGRAVAPLKYYIQAKGKSLDASRAKLRLARAYVEQSKYREALMTTTEVLRRKDLPNDLETQGLLLKSESLVGLNRDQRASQALSAAQSKLKEVKSSELQAQSAWLDLKLKTRKCAKLPSPGRLTEDQVKSQIERRGSCLLDALLSFREVLKTESTRWAKEAADTLSFSFRTYEHACQNPPRPPGKRTAKQLTQYRLELVDALKQVCGAKYSEALDLLKSWQKELKGASSSYINQVSDRIRELKATR